MIFIITISYLKNSFMDKYFFNSLLLISNCEIKLNKFISHFKLFKKLSTQRKQI